MKSKNTVEKQIESLRRDRKALESQLDATLPYDVIMDLLGEIDAIDRRLYFIQNPDASIV
jgi:hypothetical protein